MSVKLVAPAALIGWALRNSVSRPLRVISVSSGAATKAHPGLGAYCSSKAALHMFDRVVAEELEVHPHLTGRDVAIVTYAPHVVATGMQETMRAKERADLPQHERFVALRAEGQLVEPSEPACQICDSALGSRSRSTRARQVAA